MPVKPRGQVIAIELGPTGSYREKPKVQRKAAAFVRRLDPDDARVLERFFDQCQAPCGEPPSAFTAPAAGDGFGQNPNAFFNPRLS
jgi:hypothetical protein